MPGAGQCARPTSRSGALTARRRDRTMIADPLLAQPWQVWAVFALIGVTVVAFMMERIPIEITGRAERHGELLVDLCAGRQRLHLVWR